jgi:hypothetical protein
LDPDAVADRALQLRRRSTPNSRKDQVMAEHPINCTAAEIKALLAGSKTQMRQLLSPHNLRIWTGGLDYAGQYVKPTPDMFAAATNNARDFRTFEGRLAWITDPAPHQVGAVMAQWLGRPLYAPGDRLYVREAHALVPRTAYARSDGVQQTPSPTEPDDAAIYRAGWDRSTGSIRWHPSSRMPRWASRLTLTVTGVRVHPLLDISEADAEAEGFAAGMMDDGFGPRDIGGGYTIESAGTYATAAGMFQMAWADRHHDWDGYSSPWVVALTFTVSRGNIDA